MSLKEFTKEIFTRYGLTEDDINVYMCYLRVPRATISEVFLSMPEGTTEYATVEKITNSLVEKGFLKKIEGIVARFIPLEPFFELFTSESETFRGEIAKIKDKVLADQSSRFEKLESIQNKSIDEVKTAVSTQVKAFFDDSDAKNKIKKDTLEKARKRFTDTTKVLEKDLHAIIEEDYTRFTTDVNKNDKETDGVWDANDKKFTTDNDTLNKALTDFTTAENKQLTTLTQTQITGSKNQEKAIHTTLDTLNSDLKTISDTFVSDNKTGITTAKDNITKLIADLLGDFAKRVDDLEKEIKMALDGHVDRHKNIANELKPKMEQILEKYLERMNKVITDLKDKISKLLNTHTTHVKTTTDSVRSNIHNKAEDRYKQLVAQVSKYREDALKMLTNLLESANRFSDFSEDLAHQGLFFTGGKKKKYKARWAQVETDVASLARPYKENFEKEVEDFISTSRGTTDGTKSDVTEIIAKENNSLGAETNALDAKAQETISAELETLASDMAGEIDHTLQSGVKDCSDTTIKVKDGNNKSFTGHHKQYDVAINRHRDDTLRHYTEFDTDIKRNNDAWVKDVNAKIVGGKKDVTAEIETQTRATTEYKDNQIKNLLDHLEKTKSKNVEHSETFDTDVEGVKTKQRKLYDDLLKKVRDDFNKSKANTSGKIDAEIKLRNEESAALDKNLNDMLEDHKVKYKDNASTLEKSLSTTTTETAQNVKDAIADFTLSFMTAIDDTTEKSENAEAKLKDIQKASSNIQEISKVTTWHTIGQNALIAAIKDAVYRTKSSIIIVTPVVIPEVLQLISEFAYQRKAARFMLTTNWDLNTYGSIVQKMKALGNIQFRNLSSQGEYYAVTRDAEETIICPYTDKEAEMVSIISNQPAYAKLYSSFIGPIFQANSRPI